MKKTAFLSVLQLLIILPVSTQVMASNTADSDNRTGLKYNTYNVIPKFNDMTSNDGTINIAKIKTGTIIGTLYIQYHLPPSLGPQKGRIVILSTLSNPASRSNSFYSAGKILKFTLIKNSYTRIKWHRYILQIPRSSSAKVISAFLITLNRIPSVSEHSVMPFYYAAGLYSNPRFNLDVQNASVTLINPTHCTLHIKNSKIIFNQNRPMLITDLSRENHEYDQDINLNVRCQGVMASSISVKLSGNSPQSNVLKTTLPNLGIKISLEYGTGNMNLFKTPYNYYYYYCSQRGLCSKNQSFTLVAQPIPITLGKMITPGVFHAAMNVIVNYK